MSGDIETRKRQHIDTVLGEDVSAKGISTGFERFFFEHAALPEIDLDAVDLSTRLFGRSLRAPLLIASMTGGTARARDINRNLAAAAEALGIAMGVGSQRAMIEDPALAGSYRVRDVAPNILLFANFGAVQLNDGYGADEARRAVETIGADALFLHFNPLQEAVQPGGDRDWSGLYRKVEELAASLDVPIVGKEVGNGIGAEAAARLIGCGLTAVDISGAGGTSWSEVEAYRQPDPEVRAVAHSFAGWGIPTAAALIDAVRAVPDSPVFASGGIRDGIDAAKAIRLGASLVGTAAPMLEHGDDAAEAAARRMERMIEELRIAAFCVGARDIGALRRAVLRRTSDWEPVPEIPAAISGAAAIPRRALRR